MSTFVLLVIKITPF